MAADSAHVADSLDIVHHEMDNVVHDYHVYKSVWSPITDEQSILKKEPVNPHDEFSVAMINNSLIVGHIPKNYLQIFYCTRWLYHLLYITGRRRKENA